MDQVGAIGDGEAATVGEEEDGKSGAKPKD